MVKSTNSQPEQRKCTNHIFFIPVVHSLHLLVCELTSSWHDVIKFDDSSPWCVCVCVCGRMHVHHVCLWLVCPLIAVNERAFAGEASKSQPIKLTSMCSIRCPLTVSKMHTHTHTLTFRSLFSPLFNYTVSDRFI